MNTTGCVIAVFVVIVVWVLIAALMRRARFNSLTEKYGNAEIARMIMDNRIWQGATPEMIVDSQGKPVEIDNKVLKTKTKQTWKYGQTSATRFDLRIMFEDGVVVGWDKKG